MSIASTSTAQSRVVLHDVRWSTFLTLSQEASGGRLAYDQGTLEIMSPSYDHENLKSLMGRLIEIYTEEREIVIASAGSTTLRREDLGRGMEADESYYIASAAKIRGNTQIDLPHDPPPDLVIEIDRTHCSLDKLEICRSLGIAEVWRFHGEQLEVHVLDDHREYQQRSQSSVLPDFPLAEATKLLTQRQSLDATSMARQFRALVREGM